MANAYGNIADLNGNAATAELAFRAMNRAIVLSPHDPDALAARAWLRTTYSRDWQGARSGYEAALKADPGNADVLGRYAWLLAALGRLPEATAMATRAYALDPLNDTSVWTVGLILNASGQFPQAQALLQKSATASTGQYTSMTLAESLVLAGKYAEVTDELQSAPALARLTGTALAEHSLGHRDESDRALDDLQHNYTSGSAFQIAEIHAWRGDTDQVVPWLERACTQHDGGMSTIKWSPFLASLRGDPRHAAMVKKMGLPD